jgi:hypothetical protein
VRHHGWHLPLIHRATLALTFCALGGCDDLFILGNNDLRGTVDFDFGGPRDFAGDDLVTPVGIDLAGADLSLPPAGCALLPCVPGPDEGDVSLDSGHLSGCHAYDTLNIKGSVTVDPPGVQICARRIVVTGFLLASGQGEAPGAGPGAGKSCGSGGSHGGVGGDAIGCGVGATYDDPAQPRLAGSGGGGSSGAGAGGGVIEIAADQLLFTVGAISADGSAGAGAAAGGGAGGSIYIHGGTVSGTGTISANGGLAIGLGGGGGGGRIAIEGLPVGSSINVNADGGEAMSSADGAPGTIR